MLNKAMAAAVKAHGATWYGTTDDVTTCDCCGRTGLKSTVAIAIGDAADPSYLGVTCASRALKIAATAVRKTVRDADDAARKARLAAQEAASRAQFARDQAALDKLFPALAGNRFAQVQAMHAAGMTWLDLDSRAA